MDKENIVLQAVASGLMTGLGVFAKQVTEQAQEIERLESALRDATTCRSEDRDAPSCKGCWRYLGGGQCAASLEQECADGGYEGWEGEDHDAD